MPPLSPADLANLVTKRNAVTDYSQSLAANLTGDPLQVVCAWPVSGSYGPAWRFAYYIIIVAFIVSRKLLWFRNVCLTAVMLLPAVAALHGIVLAALHVDNAVNMDIYGALQLCLISILAAPLTVRLSLTYYIDAGRNIVFCWTCLILAGLLCLFVEFYRANTTDCFHDDSGNLLAADGSNFPYSSPPSCGLTCSVIDGPFSPIRQGLADSISVIPAPSRITFGAATILAGASCILATILLVSMWNKVLKIQWKRRFGRESDDSEVADGTNGATVGQMRKINSLVDSFFNAILVPISGALILAFIVVGELNLWSSPVHYHTEPITSIGQWGTLATIGMAAIALLYLLFAAAWPEPKPGSLTDDDDGSVHLGQGGRDSSVDALSVASRTPDARPPDNHDNEVEIALHSPEYPSHGSEGLGSMGQSHAQASRTAYTDASSTVVPSHTTLAHPATLFPASDTGKRRQVAQSLAKIGNFLGNPQSSLFDDSEFKMGRAVGFPEIPGEFHRNRDLHTVREEYYQRRWDERSRTSQKPRSRLSRSSSFNGSEASARTREYVLPSTTATNSPPSYTGRSPPPRTSLVRKNLALSLRSGSRKDSAWLWRSTLEVPSPVTDLMTSAITDDDTPKMRGLAPVTVDPSHNLSSDSPTPAMESPQEIMTTVDRGNSAAASTNDDLLPDMKLDDVYQSGQCWTCTPVDSVSTDSVPVKISDIPVVIPVESRYPVIMPTLAPPDPHPKFIVPTAHVTDKVIAEIFNTYEHAVGFYLLINGQLQVIVPDDFDYEYALSHRPRTFGGLEVSYIYESLTPSAGLTGGQKRADRPRSASDATSRTHSTAATGPTIIQPPQFNQETKFTMTVGSTINAVVKGAKSKERFEGRVGLMTRARDRSFVAIPTHIITSALSAAKAPSFPGDDWIKDVQIYSSTAHRELGPVSETFDPAAAQFPTGFVHDISLVDVSKAPTDLVSNIKTPIPTEWLSRAGWQEIKYRTTNLYLLNHLSASLSKQVQAKSVGLLESQCQAVGQGIFRRRQPPSSRFSLRRNDKETDSRQDAETWTRLVSRSILFRIHPEFRGQGAQSGTAVCTLEELEDGTKRARVAGFTAFAQEVSVVQSFDLEGPRLYSRLEQGRVAFYGAFEVPDKLRDEHVIV